MAKDSITLYITGLCTNIRVIYQRVFWSWVLMQIKIQRTIKIPYGWRTDHSNEIMKECMLVPLPAIFNITTLLAASVITNKIHRNFGLWCDSNVEINKAAHRDYFLENKYNDLFLFPYPRKSLTCIHWGKWYCQKMNLKIYNKTLNSRLTQD